MARLKLLTDLIQQSLPELEDLKNAGKITKPRAKKIRELMLELLIQLARMLEQENAKWLIQKTLLTNPKKPSRSKSI